MDTGRLLRARVASQPVLLQAPDAATVTGRVEIQQDFAAEAVVADCGDTALDTRLVLSMPTAGGVDVKAAGLRVLEEGRCDPGGEPVGTGDDRFGVVRDEDPEDAAEESPRRFARLDRPPRRLLEGGIHETVAGVHSRENPGPETPVATLALGNRQPTDPARIDLHLLARLAVEHRDRRLRPPEAQLLDGEAVQHRIAEENALPGEQLADLCQPHAFGEPPLDAWPLGRAHGPPLTSRPSARRVQREQNVAQLLVGRRRAIRPQAGRTRDLEIPSNRLRVQPQLRRYALGRHALAPQSEHLSDFNHRDLAVHHASRPARPLGREVYRAIRGGGKGFEKPQAEGGKGFEKVVRKGSLGFENRQTRGGRHPGQAVDMRNETPPDAIDTRIVYRIYGGLMLAAGFVLAAWGPSLFGTDLSLQWAVHRPGL